MSDDEIGTESEEMASNFLPLIGDSYLDSEIVSKKGDYLTERVCGFSVREAIKLSGVSEKSVRRWRDQDENFRRLDTEGMTELREKFSSKYLDLMFSRNMHLFLRKDFKVLYKDACNEPLSDEEQSYLNKIRQFYTPQSLAMMKQLISGGTIQEPFNFTKTVMTIRQERRELEIQME